MLLPDDNGFFRCETGNCEYKTPDIYNFFDHCKINMRFPLDISPTKFFDLYRFMYALNESIRDRNNEEAYELVQSFGLMLANVYDNDFDEFVEEARVQEDTYEVIKGLERMLKDERNK